MMKRFLLFSLFLVLLFPATSPAQIPNAGFENWTQGAALNPDGWTTFNITGYAVPVTRSTSAHTGQYAAQGSVTAIPLVPGALMSPYMYSFFGYKGRPASLNGWYQFTSAGHDSLTVAVELWSSGMSQVVCAGVWSARSNTSGYTQFSVPLEYASGIAADTAWVWVLIEAGDNDTIHVGSTFLLDDLSFQGNVAGVAPIPSLTPTSFALDQNYPNPFNPSTTIRFSLPEASHVRLTVFNLLGEELAVLINEQRQPGVYDQKFDASGLPSGSYFYRIEAQGLGGAQAKSFVQVRKMTIVK